MGDYKFFGGAATGPAVVRQNVELTPYGTDYRRTELVFGVESAKYVSFLLPASWLRWTGFVDVTYEDTAGGQINWGSRRTAGFLQGGTRFRATPPGVLVGDIRLGVGGASNDLNFGKGINPPHEYSFNIQVQATVGAMFCLNPDFCLGPVVGGAFDAAAYSTGRDYTSSHMPFFGFRIEGQVNHSEPPNDPTCKKEKELCEKQIPVLIHERDQCRNTVKQLQAANADDVPRVPVPVVEKAGESRPTEPGKSLPIRPRPPATQSPAAKSVAVSQDPKDIEYRGLRELPKGIQFQNDKADLLPLPQQFPLCRGKCGDGNPILNLVIFGVRRWAISVAQMSHGKDPDYKMDVFVQGLANDTGDPRHNLELANQRRMNVINYLSGGGKSYDRRNYEGQPVPPLSATTKVGSGRNQRNLGDIVTIRPIETQSDPADDIIMIMTGKKRSNLNPAEIEQIKFKVKGEEWRKSVITYKIYKLSDDGKYHEITVDQYIQERIFGMTQEGVK